jgi:PAS domain S-box-containing protein
MQNLRKILSSISDAVWSYDLINNVFIYKNNRLAELYETSLLEVEESPEFWLRAVHPDDYNYAVTESNLAYAGKNVEIEYRLIINNRIKWVLDKKVVLLDEEGRPEIITGILSDITDKKNAELKLTDTTRAYRYLFLNNPNPLWIYDKKTLQFLAVNNAAIAKYGYSKEEFLSMTIADIRPKEDIPVLLEEVGKVKPVYTNHKRYWRHLKKNGDVLYVNISGHGILHNGHDAEIIMAHDITTEVHSRQQIMLAKENLDTLINNIDQEIWSIDTQYRLISANEAFKSASMLSGRELNVGDSVFNASYDEGDKKQWKKYYDKALAGNVFTFVEFVSAPNRLPYFAEIKMNPIKIKTKIIGVACIAANIQERLEAHEKILSQNRKLHEVISLASHDIRGPVASLLGLVAAFNREDPSDSSNQEILKLVAEMASNLDAVLHTLVAKSYSLRDDTSATNGALYNRSASE